MMRADAEKSGCDRWAYMSGSAGEMRGKPSQVTAVRDDGVPLTKSLQITENLQRGLKKLQKAQKVTEKGLRVQ